jgi:colanic acid/amylovoran biosynthesis glycosyltransferase
VQKIKVLHAFRRYLPVSVNWAYRLIEATPQTENHIYAHYFEKNNFYAPGWKFVDLGTPDIAGLYKVLGRSGKDLLTRIALRFFLRLVRTKHAQFVRRYIGDEGIAVVHSHFGPFSCTMSELIRDMNVKHVVSFYGYDYEKVPFRHPVFIAKYKALFQSASAFICEGTHGAETLAQMGCPREKLHVVRLGLIPTQVSFVKRAKKKDSLRLLQIASITEKKGHQYTVSAFLEALKTSPDMTLTIVGSPKSHRDHAILEAIKEQVQIHNAGEKVFFIPRIDYSGLYDFMEQYDVFIHPSCYASDMDCEGGAPVVLLDCQATGMPVISTTHCDIPDEVIHGVTGLLSKEKDLDGLVKSIESFYRMSDEEFVQFSMNARKHIETNFDISNSGKMLIEIYSAIAKNSN